MKGSLLGLAGLGIAAPFILKKRMLSSLFNRCPFEGSIALADDHGVAAPSGSPDPIAELTSPMQREFAGDRPSRAHHALWDKANYLKSKGGIPAPTETTTIAVIGGGISGLTAAYSLQDLKPIVLEQAGQFGGNSKGERWEGSNFSIGAAYINVPDRGSDLEKMLTDLGLQPAFRSETGKNEAVSMKGKLSYPFWQGVTDPSRAAEFKKVFEKLISMTGNLPPIPLPADLSASERVELNRLDQMSFQDWVKAEFGEVHPHIEELFREYCWSAFCTDYPDVSAAQAINFLCSDLVVIQTVPGGNGGIAQALYTKLKKNLPGCSLRAGCLVVDISHDAKDPNLVNVCYEGPDGNLRTIQAKAVVNTSAKFINKTVISGLSDDQWDAMDSLKYRAYVVANVLLKNPIKSPGYDVYCLKGEPPADPKEAIRARVWTDLTYATWAQDDQGSHAVVSLYRPYAYDGGRKELYQEGSYERLKKDFHEAVPGMLSSMGIDPTAIVEIRLSRWGHSIPAAEKGLIADGTLERAAKPFGRVFFGQQDNWASPCFESAVQCATEAAAQARKAVGRL